MAAAASKQLENRALVADMTRSLDPKIGSLEAKAAFEAALAEGKARERLAAAAAAAAAEQAKKLEEGDKRAAAAAKAAEEAARRDAIAAMSPVRLGGIRRRRVTAKRFCGCVKKVKSAKKNRTEGSAIAVCTSSLLWPHGRTLHSVSCRSRKASIKTQKRTLRKK
jgi:hypothetical protein